MTSSIVPTIGRRVYVWAPERSGLTVIDPEQAFDAGIIYVHKDGKVTTQVTDHVGRTTAIRDLELHDPTPADRHGKEGAGTTGFYATWMPYQVGQASSVKAAASPIPAPKVPPTQTK